MTFKTLWDDKLDIELSTADTVLFTTDRRKQAVRDAELEFVRATGCIRKYGEIPITDGDAEYSLFAVFTDFIRLAADPSIRIVDGADTRYIQGPKDFPKREYDELNRLEPGWESADSGHPHAWYVKNHQGTEMLGMTPPPDIEIGEVWDWIVPYVCKPSVMSADTHEPFTVGGAVHLSLEPYHQGLAHYAAYLLEPLRKNYTGAQRQLTLYASFVARYEQQKRRDGGDQITLMRDYLAERPSRAPDPRRWP